ALAVSALDARAALTGAIVSTRGDAYYATRIARGYLAFFVPFLMLLIASIAIFGSNRSHGASINAVIAVAAGFLYVVFDGVAGTLSEVGAIDAIIAATVPTAAFGALGIWALIKLEEL
ncbi:MAG: LptF/LptG family permease, partial [Pseudomonadota bacterium]